MSMRLNSKKYFLTYSQCPVPKEVLYEHLSKLFGNNLEKIVVGAEKHEDGNPHLHSAVWLKKRIDKKNGTRFFDIYYEGKNYHANHQTLKSDDGARMYVCKEGDVIANFNWKEWKIKGKGPSKTTIIMDETINRKRNMAEVIKEVDIGMAARTHILERGVEAFERLIEERDVLPSVLPNPWGKILWSRRDRKKRHYWIFSRQANRGKTTGFAKPLEKAYRCSLEAGEFAFWNVKKSDQAVILDEYNAATLKYHTLNQMCDGTFKYRIFQAGYIRLNDPLIIVLSNQSLSELYPFMNHLLYERFIEIEIH